MDISRISSCTYPVRELDVELAFKVMADAGVRKVDLWGNMPQFSLISVACSLDDLIARAEAQGVRIANLGSYPGRAFASDNPAVRETEVAALKTTLLAARALGARSIRVIPGQGDDPGQIDRIAPCFAEGAELAEQIGVYMGMENHAGSLAGSPEDALRLCQAVGSKHFGVLYEPANLMHGGVDYHAAFAVFGEYITHLHVKDGRVGPQGFARTHLGEGDIDYRWVIDSLEGIGYTGDYALEYEICDLEPIETGLARWVEYFRSL
jgi:sugar phosphate isomerase/epimerase